MENVLNDVQRSGIAEVQGIEFDLAVIRPLQHKKIEWFESFHFPLLIK